MNNEEKMAKIVALKKEILENYKRLNLNDSFRFSCNKDVPCFNACCKDINIFLTPYDILRMKKRLGLSSEEFLSKFTLTPFTKDMKLPVVVLKMGEDPSKKCSFVSEDGCTIYEDRPWPCRMYPLGFASPGEGLENEKEFYFLMDEPDCLGFKENREYTVESWLSDQGLNEYNEMGEFFKEISLHPYFEKNDLSPEKMEMYFTACYNLDKFRRFIFASNFLKYFDVDNETIEKIKEDDIELMKFAFRWLKFSLFGENTMKMKDEAVRERKEGIGKNKKGVDFQDE